jgi:hypothetical protein
MSSDYDREKKMLNWSYYNPDRKSLSKSCLLCFGTAPTDGGHVAHKDHLFGNKTELSDSVPKYVKQGNRLWNLQA